MKDLLKADFKRIFKDKLLIITAIIAFAFALITPVLYKIIISVSGEPANDIVMSMLSGAFNAKTQFFGSFSIGNNFGLVAPVLLAIVMCKDFSYGTIRNKIIAGKSRSSIFMAMFITCSSVFVGIMLIHSFATLGCSLIFFEYQSAPFTTDDFKYFIVSLMFEILALIFVSSFLTYLCANMKNVGLVIVVYVAFALSLAMVGSVIQVALSTMGMRSYIENDTLFSMLSFLDRINVATSTMYIGTGTEYTLKDVLYAILPSLIGIAGFLTCGLAKFNKRDIK